MLRGVAEIGLIIGPLENDPQAIQALAPGEAVVAIGIEVKMRDSLGMMNIAIPALFIKLLRHNLLADKSVRKAEPTEFAQLRVLDLIRDSVLGFDVRLEGPTLKMKDLVMLEEGDVLLFDAPVGKPFVGLLNGLMKFRGHLLESERRLSFTIAECVPELLQT